MFRNMKVKSNIKKLTESERGWERMNSAIALGELMVTQAKAKGEKGEAS